MLPLFSGLLSYLVEMKRRTSRCFTCKRDSSHFLPYLKNPSIMPLAVFLVSKDSNFIMRCVEIFLATYVMPVKIIELLE